MWFMLNIVVIVVKSSVKVVESSELIRDMLKSEK